MKKLLFLALILVSAAALAQSNMRVRGTISSLDGDVLSVKSRDGKDLKLYLTPDAQVAVAKKLPVMVTGAMVPSGPLAYVFVDQGGHPRSDLIGDIHPCQPSANRELKCRERRRP